ncbi:MAG: hypothetical protein QM607_12210 [Microbacterium sp.]
MSSEVSKTVVPSGITDPVELARAELKAALAAIEIKANLPKRAAEATSRGVAKVKAIAQRQPVVVALAVVGVAAGVGTAVWGAARLISR